MLYLQTSWGSVLTLASISFEGMAPVSLNRKVIISDQKIYNSNSLLHSTYIIAYRIDSTPPSDCGWLNIVGIRRVLREAYGRYIIAAIHMSVQLERKNALQN